jgi:hypothetical protein
MDRPNPKTATADEILAYLEARYPDPGKQLGAMEIWLEDLINERDRLRDELEDMK